MHHMTTVIPFPKRKQKTVTQRDVVSYLMQKDVPESVAILTVRFLKEQSNLIGEPFLSKRVIQKAVSGELFTMMSEVELESLYKAAPAAVNHYATYLLSDPVRDSERSILSPVQSFSEQAKRAYVCISEIGQQAVYAIKHEPPAVWRSAKRYGDSLSSFGELQVH